MKIITGILKIPVVGLIAVTAASKSNTRSASSHCSSECALYQY